ncbi:hypothetical protein [Streptosporangium sp. NPDC051022]|uniref:hypothetical protein n=1 Tax=Streptosporangium sp. NPDC051022 TaxID=3155752 RepID=UPI00342B4B53
MTGEQADQDSAGTFTAEQVHAMVTHIERCPLCGAGDAELLASLYDESLPPDELAVFIATGHDPAWLRHLLGRAA